VTRQGAWRRKDTAAVCSPMMTPCSTGATTSTITHGGHSPTRRPCKSSLARSSTPSCLPIPHRLHRPRHWPPEDGDGTNPFCGSLATGRWPMAAAGALLRWGTGKAGQLTVFAVLIGDRRSFFGSPFGSCIGGNFCDAQCHKTPILSLDLHLSSPEISLFFK
jgi:hypothetical protein